MIEDFKIALARKRARNWDKSDITDPPTLSAKSINNILTIRRMLVIARKRGLIAVVPEIDWLKLPAQEFDFENSELDPDPKEWPAGCGFRRSTSPWSAARIMSAS